MRCMSCTADIPPQWVNALQNNVCPGCGGEIMNGGAKELLDELTAAMERMPNNPQGLAGWLMSNYHFRKIGDATPTEHFHTKRGNGPGQQEDFSGLKVADNPAQALLRRTDQYKNIQATRAKLASHMDPRMAEMAAGIAQVESDMYGGEVADPAMAQEYSEQNAAAQQYYDQDDDVVIERGPKLSRALVTGAQLVDARAKPLSPEELAALAGSIPADEDINVSDDQARRVLNAQRLKRLHAQQGVQGGGGMGVFRRGD